MSHRENSLTPWITTDAEREKRKAATAEAQKYPLPPDYPKVFLNPALYDVAEREGYDMRFYVKQEPIPVVIEHKLPTSAEMRAETERKIAAMMRAETERKIAANERLGATHNIDYGPTEARIMAHGSIEPPDHLRYAKMQPSDKPRWPCRGEGSVTGRTVKLCDDSIVTMVYPGEYSLDHGETWFTFDGRPVKREFGMTDDLIMICERGAEAQAENADTVPQFNVMPNEVEPIRKYMAKHHPDTRYLFG